jgi:hypothetical protein
MTVNTFIFSIRYKDRCSQHNLLRHFKQGDFLKDFFNVLYSTLLPLPPLRFHCVGDAGIEFRTVTTLALAVRRSNRSARSHPLRKFLVVNRIE